MAGSGDQHPVSSTVKDEGWKKRHGDDGTSSHDEETDTSAMSSLSCTYQLFSVNLHMLALCCPAPLPQEPFAASLFTALVFLSFVLGSRVPVFTFGIHSLVPGPVRPHLLCLGII